MIIRILVAACLLIASSASDARVAAGDSKSLIERANAQAESITDAEAFLEEVDDSVELGRSGEYGRLSRGQLARLESARKTIVSLLEGHASAMELPPAERIDLYNAQEVISSTLNNDDKDRMVCRKEVRLGSRLPMTECLTVAEREERASVSRDSTDRLQRNVCTPGEGQSCSK